MQALIGVTLFALVARLSYVEYQYYYRDAVSDPQAAILNAAARVNGSEPDADPPCFQQQIERFSYYDAVPTGMWRDELVSGPWRAALRIGPQRGWDSGMLDWFQLTHAVHNLMRTLDFVLLNEMQNAPGNGYVYCSARMLKQLREGIVEFANEANCTGVEILPPAESSPLQRL